jgi:hypothetical protein
MRAQHPDRTGILIVRVWIEGTTLEGFRSRITRTLDSAGAEHEVAVAAAPDDVYAVVQTWVQAFVDQETGAHPVTPG